VLEGHEDLAVGVDHRVRPGRQDLVHHRPERDRPQEVLHHDRLVVPPGQLAGPLEARVVVGDLGLVGDQPLDDPVVELEERQVQLRDDQVLVVARVADARLSGGARSR
jgi:hypothetical protein